jgi:hypothetical protein
MKTQKKVLLIALSCIGSTSPAAANAGVVAEATIVTPPVVTPPVVTPPVVTLPPGSPIAVPGCCPAVTPATVSYRPLVAIAPMPCAYEVGRGILGQPKLYVPDQPVRNFFRWISP